ncbi:MAG TPA: tetratricopeptide repeat protein [Candidatus Binatia bacterium]|nr:tetratricopeptide repeat protein [Candidatus Binatia bacterium]
METAEMVCAGGNAEVLRGDTVKSRYPLTSFCLLIFLGGIFPARATAQTQTFEVNGGSSPSSNKQPKQNSAQPSQGNSDQGFGWGSSIEVARQAHAAQDALRRNDFQAALSFAENAAKSAPQDPQMWFLLGYTARLADRYSRSVEAYNQGLKLRPGSTAGMAGLAQTYAKMGRTDEAAKLLDKVVNENPRDANSMQLAGELLLNSDDNKALDYLKRAESIAPSAHSELLIAHAYDRLNQPAESSRYLERARSRAPRDPEVLRAVADQYRDQGKYDQAISALQAIPSKNLDVDADLAYTYQLAGRPQEAADVYVKVAKSAKGNLNLNLSAAQALVNLGQPEAAEPFIDEARRIDPNNYRLHAILGAIAESDNRLPDAAAEYAAAIQNLPPQIPEGPLYPVELRLNLYEVDERQGDETAARQQLSAAMGLVNSVSVPESSRPEMLRVRAAIEAGSGDTGAANRDLQEALRLAPSNLNSLLNYASLEWKLGQKDAAEQIFAKVLELDPRNRTALSSLGFLARDKGDTKAAEDYFKRAALAHPKDFAPYLALGDLYTSSRDFKAAEANYEDAYQRMPANPSVISGAANAALEAHNMDLAARWLDRARGKANDSPQVNRERERYLTLKGDYEASAKLGYSVLDKLPKDREGVVYLAYDVYYLGRYDEVAALLKKYDQIFSDDKDIALIQGYLDVHQGHLEAAVDDFTRALERDPKMATGYVNRGFVENDLRQPNKASQDFHTAIQLQTNYGEAHLGLAFSDLQLHRPKAALTQLQTVQKLLGKSHTWRLARAEAFRQAQDFVHAESEYRAALQEDPKDLNIHLAYADTLFRLRRFPQALAALDAAQNLAPTDARLYALRAQIHAKEGDRGATNRDVEQAERYGQNDVDILMSTGTALLTLGERDAAMQRFSRALDAPKGDRTGVRLSVAQVFMRQGHYDEARREIALGFAEARSGSSQVTAEDIAEAANTFLAMHDFNLAETYFDKARLAGANQRTVGIGLANTYLAEGETHKAEDALAAIGPASDYTDDYDYMMAEANVYRQRQDTVNALSAFARASTVAGPEDEVTSQTARNELASEEGRQITQNVSISPEALFAPALEDINVYTLDAKILHVTSPSLLPPPRHSFQSLAESHYKIHLGNFPAITGFVGESLTVGRFLFPSENVVEDRNTYDTIINGGVTPIWRFGSNSIAFNGGLQFIVRRDTISPQYMSQNLFRQFLYVSSNSFFNWVSFNGAATREAGPFTENNLNSRDAYASIEFNVGRPWGHTSLITGYNVRDLLFHPLVEEYFNTASYIGLQHKFGSRVTAAILAEDLRSWQVQATQYATAQAFLPGGRFEVRATPRWSVQGSFLLSRGEAYHEYDNAQSQFAVSYMRALPGSEKYDAAGVPVSHPFRLSFGIQQQTFYNFNGATKTTLLPVIHFNLF